MYLQFPSNPDMAQCMQVPAQVESQHTSSTQLPEMHSDPPVHASPFCLVFNGQKTGAVELP
jgi:hypothetical protein